MALVAPLFSNNTVDFSSRLVRALGYPKLVLPTHWDNFEAPLTGTPTDLRAVYGDPANLDLWVKEMKKLTPRTRIAGSGMFQPAVPAQQAIVDARHGGVDGEAETAKTFG